MSSDLRSSLWFTGPKKVEVRHSQIPVPRGGEVLVKARCSGISAGTELLAYTGMLPDGIALDTTITKMKGDTGYPFKYGYSTVGNVLRVGQGVSQELLGKRIYAFHPHESHFVVSEKQVIVLPDDVETEDALFLANMETAVSLVLDGRPMLGDRVLVFGLGVVGQLLTAILRLFPLSKLVAIDPSEKRRVASGLLGPCDTASSISRGSSVKEDHEYYDVVYETSGSPLALGDAVNCACYNGQVIVASWYGKKEVKLDLGSYFHRSKISIYASQVSELDPGLTGRWDKARRFTEALQMLRKIQPRHLITHEYTIEDAGKAYEVLSQSMTPIQTIITY